MPHRSADRQNGNGSGWRVEDFATAPSQWPQLSWYNAREHASTLAWEWVAWGGGLKNTTAPCPPCVAVYSKIPLPTAPLHCGVLLQYTTAHRPSALWQYTEEGHCPLPAPATLLLVPVGAASQPLPFDNSAFGTQHAKHNMQSTAQSLQHKAHTSHITHHTSHITHHTSHITHHTSHITHHTSHITHHTNHNASELGLEYGP